ncbi:hypothetical protein WJX73_003285 [Symbiochloris irregularis]|uniref:Vacuolar protein sorting-associated protein 54 C-terminal domain-containing protein n=1 Tax=Symbiochloris irregularis TaxID=706552 RepID=A0AAW1NR29_9CHLO
MHRPDVPTPFAFLRPDRSTEDSFDGRTDVPVSQAASTTSNVNDTTWERPKRVSDGSTDDASSRFSLESAASSRFSLGVDARASFAGAPSGPLRTSSSAILRGRKHSLTARDAALFTASQGLTPLLNAPGQNATAGQASWGWVFGGQAPLPLVPPPLAPGLLPEVQELDFLPYLRAHAETHVRFQHAARKQREHDQGTGIHGRHEPGEGLVAALREVPQMYFAEDFSLTRQDTWEAVGLGSQTDAELALRHDQAQAHFDACETHFTGEVAARSAHFFEAAGVVSDARSSLGGAFDLVHGLRAEVRDMKEGVLENAVRVQALQRRRGNLVEVDEQLRVIALVVAALEAASLLVPQGAFLEVLEVVDEIRGIAASGVLSGLHAFRDLPSQLAYYAQAVNETMVSSFLQATFNAQLDALVSVEVLGVASSYQEPFAESASQPHRPADILEASTAASEAASDAADLDIHVEVVRGLLRTGRLQQAIAACRDMMVVEVKQGIRDVVEQSLPALLDPTWEIPADAFLADKLQVLSPQSFMLVLSAVRNVFSACLQHACRVQAAVLAAAQSAAAASAPSSMLSKAPALPRGQEKDLQKLLGTLVQSITDAALSRWTKLLAARAGQAASGSLEELQELLSISADMAQLSEASGALPSQALCQALQLQCRAFLDHLHRSHISCLSKELDGELWAAAEVPASSQAIADGFQHSGGQLYSAQSAPENAAPGHAESANGDEASDVYEEKLHIGSESYFVIEGLLTLLQLLRSYQHLQQLAPELVPELAHRAVELIKVFNSRTCQLAIFTSPITPGRRALLIPEFERALKDLKIHHAEILGKFVAIMRERLTASLRQLPAAASQWRYNDESAQGQQYTPSPFAASLTKQLRILSQVLSTMLHPRELETVFGDVTKLYSRAVCDAFTQLPSQGQAWEAQAATDLHALLAALQDGPPVHLRLSSRQQSESEELFMAHTDSRTEHVVQGLQHALTNRLRTSDVEEHTATVSRAMRGLVSTSSGLNTPIEEDGASGLNTPLEEAPDGGQEDTAPLDVLSIPEREPPGSTFADAGTRFFGSRRTDSPKAGESAQSSASGEGSSAAKEGRTFSWSPSRNLNAAKMLQRIEQLARRTKE